LNKTIKYNLEIITPSFQFEKYNLKPLKVGIEPRIKGNGNINKPLGLAIHIGSSLILIL
jgi:hypothetical protein